MENADTFHPYISSLFTNHEPERPEKERREALNFKGAQIEIIYMLHADFFTTSELWDSFSRKHEKIS
jgi:hypothetical protein